LNPDIWNNDGTIKDDVSDSLLTIVKDFYKDTELTGPIEDVYLIGSAAAYNWTPTSDLDLHVAVDFSKINKDTDLVTAYANLLKAKWNKDHDVTVKNHPVEVYLQDIDHKSHSLGIYSLKNKKWVKKPEYSVPKIDKESIKKKYKELAFVIDNITHEKDFDKISKMVKKIYDYRQSGLDKNGEFSTENIVFKLLRRAGYIDKLKTSANLIKDKQLSKV
jgi:predicted nucleotidyltransferase